MRRHLQVEFSSCKGLTHAATMPVSVIELSALQYISSCFLSDMMKDYAAELEDTLGCSLSDEKKFMYIIFAVASHKPLWLSGRAFA